MSLTKQNFDDWPVSIKQHDRSFSWAVKKSNHSKHVKGFPITRGSNIFSIRLDGYILAGNIACKVNPLLRNVGYNNNSIQNQNVFWPTAKDALALVLQISNYQFNRSIEERIDPYSSKLFLIPTIRWSPYYHTSWKQNQFYKKIMNMTIRVKRKKWGCLFY